MVAIKDGELYRYTRSGRLNLNGDCPADFVHIPERFEFKRWVNVYRNKIGGFAFSCNYGTKSQADKESTAGDRIACIELVITGEVGQGL